MDKVQLRQLIINTLQTIAPDLNLEQINDQQNIQEQWDLDSVDVLNFMIKLQQQLQVAIPNQDYRKCLTIKGASGYLSTRLGLSSDSKDLSETKPPSTLFQRC